MRRAISQKMMHRKRYERHLSLYGHISDLRPIRDILRHDNDLKKFSISLHFHRIRHQTDIEKKLTVKKQT